MNGQQGTGIPPGAKIGMSQNKTYPIDLDAALRKEFKKFRAKVIRLELNEYSNKTDVARLLQDEIEAVKLIFARSGYYTQYISSPAQWERIVEILNS